MESIYTENINGERVVLLVACLSTNGRTNKGFIWPREGTINTKEGVGLFGWPWGIGIGEGNKPKASATWVVFSARPENVSRVKGSKIRCQVFPGEDGSLPKVVYYGTLSGAMIITLAGRMACIRERERYGLGSEQEGGALICKGTYASVNVTKQSSNAVAVGIKAVATAAAYDSVAVAHGTSAVAVTAGDASSANALGAGSIAVATGPCSIASAAGGGSATAQATYSIAASAGHRGESQTHMSRSIAASAGDNSCVKVTGRRSIAAAAGEGVILEVSSDSIGVACSDRLSWRVKRRAKLLVQYQDERTGLLATALFDAQQLGLNDRDFAVINRGVLTVLNGHHQQKNEH